MTAPHTGMAPLVPDPFASEEVERSVRRAHESRIAAERELKRGGRPFRAIGLPTGLVFCLVLLAALAPMVIMGIWAWTQAIAAPSANGPWYADLQIQVVLVPLALWLGIVAIVWLVVDRILLRPFAQLRLTMDRYRPGDRLAHDEMGPLAAREIVMMQTILDQLAGKVEHDKQALAEHIMVQRGLTREVHHRVKNNLQIIASLINLHSRDARNAEEMTAYRTIQRRVDALAVVHRYLHAEEEDGAPGIAAAGMLGEISIGLRHSLSHDHGTIQVSVDADAAQITQDIAVPVAFFVTELVELSGVADSQAPITITLTREAVQRDNAQQGMAQQDMAQLRVQSAGLIGCEAALGDRYPSYQRVLSGLARQLRQPLVQDDAAGQFSVAIALIAED